MQYKIPVQVENTDKIIGPFSPLQLIVLVFFGAAAYILFTKLEPEMGAMAAGIPSFIIVAIGLFVTLAKIYDMTFIPFIFTQLRFTLNVQERYWQMNTDSFQPLDVGVITQINTNTKEQVIVGNKYDSSQELREKLSKL